MAARRRPGSFTEAMDVARSVTDDRTEFDVYLAVARRVVADKIGTLLMKLPITEKHRQELIAAEAYSLAQPAHLKDASKYAPTELMLMLESIAVIRPVEDS